MTTNLPLRRSKPTQRTAADELPIQSLSADGLLVRDDGALVRYLELIPTNPLVYDADGCERMTTAMTRMLMQIPAHMSIQCYVQGDHVSLEELVQSMRAETDGAAAPLLASAEPLRQAQGHALRGLADLHEEGICQWSEAQAALQVKFVLVVPFEPAKRRRPLGALPVDRPVNEKTPLRRRLADHLSHARDSYHLTEQLATALRAVDFTVTMMKGPQVADLLWRRLAPTKARSLPEQAPSRSAPCWVGSLDHAIDAPRSQQAAARLRTALAQGAIDTRPARHVVVDGDLELTGYLSRRPQRTFYGWLLYAMQSDYPWTLSVHIHMRDRQAEMTRLQRQGRMLSSLNQAENGPGNIEQFEQESEVQSVRLELATGAQSVADVSYYLSIRQPGGHDPRALRETALRALREMSSHIDAAVQQGEGQQPDLWRSTLPLGLDVARRTIRMVSRNAADSVPFCSTSCGSSTGIPFAFAEPGRTVERINPFDRLHRNPLTLLYATSGSGKTATLAALATAAIARGTQVSIIDRSTGGHYKFMCSLIPGAEHIELGAEESQRINCWDVDDLARVPREKVVFLVQLHSLLIGDHDAAGGAPGLEPLERSLLGRAIRETYRRALEQGRVPRESMLREVLNDLTVAERVHSEEHSAVYRRLTLNVADLCDEGTYAYLFDGETSVDFDREAPVVVFNTAQLPNDVDAAVLFVVFDYITNRVSKRWEHQLHRRAAGHVPAGPFDGASMLVFEEVWKLLESPATAGAVAERARRGRHIGLWTVALSQSKSDMASPHAKALLDNAVIHLMLGQSKEDLAGPVIETAGLSSEELTQISQLQTIKEEVAEAYMINGRRGRGAVGIRLGTRLYWAVTTEPHEDVPLRAQALQQADGNPWEALDLLADPTWRTEHQRAVVA
jgi:hypothetical protein